MSPTAARADIPEEDIWLAKQKSKLTRRAYKQDVELFMRTLTIRSYDELRQDYRAVIAWEHIMRESGNAAPSTVRRRLAALSSLFKHLVRHNHVEKNPVAGAPPDKPKGRHDAIVLRPDYEAVEFERARFQREIG